MDNPEKLATLDTQGTRCRPKQKQKTNKQTNKQTEKNTTQIT